MDKEHTQNDNLINEYINVMAKKYNDLSLEVVTIQARHNVIVKEKEQLLKAIEAKDKDIEDLQAEVIRERETPSEVKEVIKEVVKEVPVENDPDVALVNENTLLKRELKQAEEKIKNLKSQLREIRNGGDTETEEVRNKQ